MVRIKVNEQEKPEKETLEEVKDKPGEDQQGESESEDQEDQMEKKVPLEKMTKAELRGEIEKLQASVEENRDLYVRSQAEMENMKKRFQKEKQGLIKFSNESLIKQLLPVLDNLEKALAHAQDENSLDALREGVDLTLKGLMDTLEKTGLEVIEAVGNPFDPNYHEAVSQLEDGGVKPGTVIQELKKGYTLNQRLIQPSMVVVSKTPT